MESASHESVSIKISKSMFFDQISLAPLSLNMFKIMKGTQKVQPLVTERKVMYYIMCYVLNRPLDRILPFFFFFSIGAFSEKHILH